MGIGNFLKAAAEAFRAAPTPVKFGAAVALAPVGVGVLGPLGVAAALKPDEAAKLLEKFAGTLPK